MCGVMTVVSLFVGMPNLDSHDFASSAPSQGGVLVETKEDGDIRKRMQDIIMSGGSKEIISYAQKVYERGLAESNYEILTLGLGSKAVGYFISGREDSALLIMREAIAIGEEHNCYRSLGSMYNNMSIFCVEYQQNFYGALVVLDKGLEVVERTGNMDTKGALLSNMAYVHYLRGDVSGLEYSTDCYELGLALKDDLVTYRGAFTSAYLYNLAGEHETALWYIREAEKVMTPRYYAMTYQIMGTVLNDMGDDRAKEYFDKVLTYNVTEDANRIAGAYLGYGKYYARRGEHTSAINMYKKGIELSEAYDRKVFLYQLYHGISDALHAIGNEGESLKYYKLYHQLSDSIFNVEKEWSINELRIQYDIGKKEKLIRDKEVELLRQQKRNLILWLGLVIVAIAFVTAWYMYRRKNRLYLEIVKQNQEAIKSREKLREERAVEKAQKEETEKNGNGSGKYANSPMTDKKGIELYERVEEMMENDKIYADKDLSIDSLADKLGTNRSYLSRTINEQSGLNFNNYVNKYRLNAATEILSDVDNDVPLKVLADQLGFNSLSPFYKSFQKEIGISPSKYRENVIKLKRQKS